MKPTDCPGTGELFPVRLMGKRWTYCRCSYCGRAFMTPRHRRFGIQALPTHTAHQTSTTPPATTRLKTVRLLQTTTAGSFLGIVCGLAVELSLLAVGVHGRPTLFGAYTTVWAAWTVAGLSWGIRDLANIG
jgi:hypothetical protein